MWTGRAVTRTHPWNSRKLEAGTVSQEESGTCVQSALGQLLFFLVFCYVCRLEESSSESVLSLYNIGLGDQIWVISLGLVPGKAPCLTWPSTYILFYFLNVCMCVCVFMQVYLEARQGVGSSGAGVPGVSDLPIVGVGNGTWVLSGSSRHPQPPSRLSSLFPAFWACLVVLRQTHQAGLELTL